MADPLTAVKEGAVETETLSLAPLSVLVGTRESSDAAWL